MRRTAHLAVAALVFGAGCGKSSPTAPPPPPALGTPRTLTVSADPVRVPFEGATVNVNAIVTVQPGARIQGVPVRFTLKHDGVKEPATNTEYAKADGRVDVVFFVGHESDLIVQAGSLERTVHFTRGAPPPIPDSPPPTCNGQPGACPPPPPSPPPPAPTPALSVRISVDPEAGDTTTGFTFQASATALNGAGPITSYAWDVDGDGIIDDTSGADISHTYTAEGVYTVRVTVSNGVQSATDAITLNVTPAVMAVALDVLESGPYTVGSQVTLAGVVTSAQPPSGSLTWEWDDNNDGVMDAIETGFLTHTRTVRLTKDGTVIYHVRVTDLVTGRSATTSRAITVVKS